MNIKDALQTSGLIERHNLTIRGPIDLELIATTEVDNSIWNATNDIVALPGETNKARRHFCKLIGGIPGYNSPQAGKHVAYEIYRPGDEKRIPENRKLHPKNLAADTQINGVCFLMLTTKPTSYKDATLPVAGNPNRAIESEQVHFGHPEGPSIQMDPESGTVKIITKKETFTFGASADMGNSKWWGNFGDFTNWLTMPNPIRKSMQIMMPDALPLTPITFEPFPNIPNITLAYKQVNIYKENMLQLQEFARVIKEQRSA